MEPRIVLLSSDPALVSVADALLRNGNRMDHFASPVEVADWSDPEVAVVVLDSQARARRHGYKLVRERYRGPLIMVLDRGDRRPELPPDVARRFLYRPFKVADLAALLAAPQPRIGPLEDAVITAWTRHASTEPPKPTLPTQAATLRQAPTARQAPTVPTGRAGRAAPRHAPRAPKRHLWRSTAQGRLRVWGATVAALSLLLLLVGLSNRGSCGPGCANLGGVGAVAGASESPVPLTSGATPPGSGGGGRSPGSSSTPAPGPAPVPGLGVPLTAGVGGLIDAISPITATDTTPPAAPEPLPGVPPPPTTAPPTTAPPTTAPPTTAPPTTAPPTTAPPTTEPPTTAPPTTEPPTTTPPTTAPPTTEPPTTAPETTAGSQTTT